MTTFTSTSTHRRCSPQAVITSAENAPLSWPHLGVSRSSTPGPDQASILTSAADSCFDPSLSMRSGEELPPGLTSGGDAPLVYLTFATVFNDNETFRAALAGIRDLNVRLVVTVGPGADPASFGSQPTNVVVERYIPQTLLLPASDVVASH